MYSNTLLTTDSYEPSYYTTTNTSYNSSSSSPQPYLMKYTAVGAVIMIGCFAVASTLKMGRTSKVARNLKIIATACFAISTAMLVFLLVASLKFDFVIIKVIVAAILLANSGFCAWLVLFFVNRFDKRKKKQLESQSPVTETVVPPTTLEQSPVVSEPTPKPTSSQTIAPEQDQSQVDSVSSAQ